MTLRNVPKAHTLEQQRQEINLIASDLNTAVDGTQTFGGDKEFSGDVEFTGASNLISGTNKLNFNTNTNQEGQLWANSDNFYINSSATNGILIQANSIALRSATGGENYFTASLNAGARLYYNDVQKFETTATGANISGDLTFDAAGSHIEFTASSWSGSAPYMEFWVGNNSGTHYAQIDGGNAGQLQIMNTSHPNGHLDLRTAKDFSVDCGGYYAILAQATGATKIWHPVSQENILNPKFETTATGAKVNGFFESSLLVNTNNTPTAGEGIEMFYDSAASGGAAGSIQAYDRDGAALTRLKIRSSNWEILNDGAATFSGNTTVGAPDVANASTGGVQAFASGQLRIQRDSAGTASDKRFQMYYGTVETASITADGFATFSGGNFQNMASTLSINTNNSSTKALDITGNGMSLKHALGSDIFFGTQDGSNGKIGTENNASLNLYANGYGNKITIDVNGSLSAAKGNLKIEDVGDGTNSVKIITDPSSGGSGSKLIFDMDNSQEAVTIYNAGLKIGSGGSDRLTLDGSGGTITFNDQEVSSVGNNVSTTATSFDHYEQGTFTPYYAFGLTSPSYSFNGGDYIRIGNVVHFYLTISATGTNNGDAVAILGLPYNPAGTDGGSASFAYNTGLVVNGATMPNIYLDPNGQIRFYDTGTGNSWAGNSGNGLSGAQLYLGGHYICA